MPATPVLGAAVAFSSSAASSRRNAHIVRKHWLAAASEAALTARDPWSQQSPQRLRISISRRPFSVQVGEQAMARNRRSTLTSVSSWKALVVCTATELVVRSSWAGNHTESFSGSRPA